MVNPPAETKVAYDSGVRNFFDPALVQRLPAALKPGDSLVSTISMPKGLKLRAPLWQDIERGVDDSSPIRTAAVLTCVARPQPADAFRPASATAGRRSISRGTSSASCSPRWPRSRACPSLERFVRFTRRPWVGTCFFGFEEPVENMPQYGRDYGRVAGISALLLCTDLKPEQKEPLLVNYVQVGIDLGAMIRAGHPGFEGFGGHGSGRKLPIVFAGLLLDDPRAGQYQQVVPQGQLRRGRADRLWRLLDGRKSGLHRALGDRCGHRRSPHRAATTGALTSTSRLRSGERARTPASPIAAAAPALPGSPKPWPCG